MAPEPKLQRRFELADAVAPLTIHTAANGFNYVNARQRTRAYRADGHAGRAAGSGGIGINNGQNMGEDTLYSGRSRPPRKDSCSVCRRLRFRWSGVTGCIWRMRRGWRRRSSALSRAPLARPSAVNVNIPSLPYDEMGEWRITRLGKRHPSQPVIRQIDPRGNPIWWIGPSGDALDASEGTDFHAVANGHISITPLQLDLTHTKLLPATREWPRHGAAVHDGRTR